MSTRDGGCRGIRRKTTLVERSTDQIRRGGIVDWLHWGGGHDYRRRVFQRLGLQCQGSQTGFDIHWGSGLYNWIRVPTWRFHFGWLKIWILRMITKKLLTLKHSGAWQNNSFPFTTNCSPVLNFLLQVAQVKQSKWKGICRARITKSSVENCCSHRWHFRANNLKVFQFNNCCILKVEAKSY